MELRPLPGTSCWVHTGVRTGFEVLFATPTSTGTGLRGTTTGMEDDVAWAVGYEVHVDHLWRTRTVVARSDRAAESGALDLVQDQAGRWSVDGVVRDDLTGCVDVDLESSAVTNTLPLHRLDLVPGRRFEVPAVFVRTDLTVQRLEQTYTLVGIDGPTIAVDYESSTFDFSCRLTYDQAGLVLDYPGLAVRQPIAGDEAGR